MTDEHAPAEQVAEAEVHPKPAPGDASAPVGAPTKAVEAWAEAKGDIKPGWDSANRYVSRKVPHFAPQHFNVAKVLRGWGAGHEVTEADYDAALREAAGVTAG